MFSSRQGFFSSDNNIVTVTGGTLTYDGNYSIRTFTTANSGSSLTITNGSLSFEYLLAGAGGRGGIDAPGFFLSGGGGGGGDVLTGNIILVQGSYVVTVSNSFAGNINTNNTRINGSTLSNAFSGGDGGWQSSGANAGFATGGISGNALYYGGGYESTYNAGGGGGARGIGTNGNGTFGAPTQTGGDGGSGVISSINGTSIEYGAGGGGSARDVSGTSGSYATYGKGGNSTSQAGQSALQNTGGGGGGTYGTTPAVGGIGSNGVAIIRYLTSGTA